MRILNSGLIHRNTGDLEVGEVELEACITSSVSQIKPVEQYT